MNHIQQPLHSNLCGQACVAMVLGIDLSSAIRLVGTKGKTNLNHLLRAIRGKRGKLKRIKFIPACRRALIRIKWNVGQGSHWVIKDGSFIFDPEHGRPIPVTTYINYHRRWGRVTSYYEL